MAVTVPSITYLDCFPFIFEEEINCFCDDPEYCLPAISTDKIAFQFKAPLLNNITPSGDFQSGTSDWDTNGWALSCNLTTGNCCLKSITGNNFPVIYNAAPAIIGTNYKITFTVTERTAGTCKIMGANNTTVFDTNGTFTVFFEAVTNVFQIEKTLDFDGCIDDIIIQEVGEDFTINLVDLDDNVISAIPYTIIDENVIVCETWSNLTAINDCYKVQILSDNPIFIDDFESDTGAWTLTGGVSIGSGLMTASVAAGLFEDADLPDVIENGCDYEVTLNVVLLPAGTSIDVTIGTDTQNIAATGSTTLTFNNVDDDELKIRFLNGNPFGVTITLEEVIIAKLNSVEATSNCYKLQDSQTCSKTKLLTWTNPHDAFGSIYDNDFEYQIRVLSDFGAPSYPGTRLIGVTTGGLKRKDYETQRKSREFGVDVYPEYVHDAISLGLAHKTFKIDGVEYIGQEDYEPTAADASKLLTGLVVLEKADQPFKTNSNC
jgi:hypothetical protein